jgi:exonuclease SbcC
MFIKKLLLKNLNSLKGEFAIDFESDAFNNNPIFAITGDIGAGKSTILDAICLALYQETPRVGKCSQKEINRGQICTIGATDCYAKVIFENKGVTYRSSWVVAVISQNKNKGAWNDPKVDLEIWRNGSFQSLANSSNKPAHTRQIEEVIGLSFDQFSKTILLAQGSFSELLKAKEEGRTEIIEKLTGTEEYRLVGQKIFNTASQKKLEIEKKKTFLAGQSEGLLSKEEVEALTTKKEAIENDKTSLSVKFKSLQKQIERLKKHQHLKIEEQSILEKQQKTNRQKDSILTAEQKLSKHRVAQSIQPSFLEYQLVKRNLLVEKEDLLKNQNDEVASRKKLADFQTNQHTVFPKLNLRGDSSKDFISQIELQLEEIKLKEDELTELDNRLDKENLKLENALKNRTAEKSRLKAIELEVSDLTKKNTQSEAFFSNNRLSIESAEKIIEELDGFNNTIKSWRDKTDGIITIPTLGQSESELIKLEQEALEKSIRHETIHIDTAFHTSSAELRNCLDSARKEHLETEKNWAAEKQLLDSIIELNAEKAALNKQISQLQKTWEDSNKATLNTIKKKEGIEEQLKLSKQTFASLHLSDGKEVESLRGALQKGDPCMVCGSTSHPFIEEDNDTLKAFAEQKLKEIDWEKQLQSLQADIEKWSHDRTRIEGEQNAKKALLERVNSSIILESKKLRFADCHELNKTQFEEKSKEAIEHCSNHINSAQKKLDAFLLNLSISATKAIQQIDFRRIELNKEISTQTESTDLKKASLKDYINTIKVEQNSVEENKKHILILNEKSQIAKESLSYADKEIENINASIKSVLQNKTQIKDYIKSVFVFDENSEQYKNSKIKEYNLLVQNIALILDRINRKTQSIKELEKALILKQQAFELALRNSTISNEKELADSLLSEDVYLSLEQECKTYHNNLLTLKTSLENVQKELNKLGEISLDEITKTGEYTKHISELELAIHSKNQDLGAINEQIINHQKREVTLGKAQQDLDKLNKDFLPFYLLNKAIGDSKGKRFANVAARYTFNKLLEFTNFHLHSLKSRYTFAFLETLSQKEQDLMIIDGQMGNNIRPAKSTLSGGETFLTSLCLALALSDLSSSKVQIKSLFIDEGFGSLDQDSLHEAISLLENLPDATGKTIGIISHVEALKQRIPTQIELKKQGNGFSKMKLPN